MLLGSLNYVPRFEQKPRCPREGMAGAYFRLSSNMGGKARGSAGHSTTSVDVTERLVVVDVGRRDVERSRCPHPGRAVGWHF